MSPWTIYFILKLNSFHDALTCFIGIAAGIAIFLSFIRFISMDKYVQYFDSGQWKKTIKKLIIGAIIAGTLSLITPTTNQAIAIMLIPKITNSETVQELPEDFRTLKEDIMKMIEHKVDNYTEKQQE